MPELRLIEPVLKPRIWGCRDLTGWYPCTTGTEPIGEAWLSPLEGPVLVKLLFPRERLSVQVHPDDAYAAAHGLGRGKSEAWYVVSAEPDAQVGVGLRPGATWSEMAAACRSGRGAEMLHWIAVAPGEVIHVPAGTVHAVGGGTVLLEVQQPSDTTFRLDDYGRGRELHLDAGLAVARTTAGARHEHGLAIDQSGLLLATDHFQLGRHCVAPGQILELAPLPEPRWLVNLEGSGDIPKGFLAELPAQTSYRRSHAGTLMEVRSGLSMTR
ncbi:MAG: class I mannose-6-phosphate isomerase [Terriglobales bacterium]